jgi:2-(1,2-epoxy-1,2-dihydrophenyl)acetyl-CoA isomerase
MKSDNIILRKENHIATLILNRPDKLNAFTRQMEDELSQALADIAGDGDIRVMVLTGAGRAFCSGGDVSEPVAEVYGGGVQNISTTLRRVYRDAVLRLYNMDIPTIAMVNGVAAGLGFDLSLACDLRVGSEKARFVVAFTRVGLTPAAGGAWLLPRVLGLSKAAELIFTADFLEAEEAERLGVLNNLVPSLDLEKETMALAERISHNSPLANRLAKLQLHKGLQTDLETALEVGATCQAICLTSAEHQEKLAAFQNRR